MIGFKLFVLVVSLFTLVRCVRPGPRKLEPLSQEFIDYVNNHPKSTWKAAPSKHFRTVSDAIRRLGAQWEPEKLRRTRRPTKVFSGRIMMPGEFDSRERWPDCQSIGQIRDQSICSSCWAFGAVEAMNDRICIHSNATVKVELSAWDLVSCCKKCGNGCDSGYPAEAWDYWVTDGIVTGGSFENQTGCAPYPFPSCEHHSNGNKPPCQGHPETPQCHQKCVTGYNTTFAEDKHYGKSSYNVQGNEHAMMEEIMTNGPIEGGFFVAEDFLNYKSGIYRRVMGRMLGVHAIKLIGWGVENGTKYWLAANSWNEEWGEQGFFRIVRGTNECGIETEAYAGMPKH